MTTDDTAGAPAATKKAAPAKVAVIMRTSTPGAEPGDKVSVDKATADRLVAQGHARRA